MVKKKTKSGDGKSQRENGGEKDGMGKGRMLQRKKEKKRKRRRDVKKREPS